MTELENGAIVAVTFTKLTRVMRVALLPSLLACGLSLVPLPAAAEDGPDAARARAFFAEGRGFLTAGRYEEACARFESSLNLVYGVGTMYNLADCWEKVGRTGSALLMFRRVAATAEARGEAERARVAIERARSLEPKVTKMRIRVAEPPKIEVKRNEYVVQKDELDASVPVDPGTYRVLASSPGKKSWSSEVEVKDTGGVVVVTVPPLSDEKPTTEAVSAPPREALAPSKPLPAPLSSPRTRGSPAMKRLGLVLAGVGGGALTAGAAFALQYKSSDTDARAVCAGTRGCTAEEVREHKAFVDDARRARTLCYVGFGVGGAALTSGAILYLLNRNAEPAPVEASAELTPSSWTAGLRARF